MSSINNKEIKEEENTDSNEFLNWPIRINSDKCLACKLFSAPLFYTLGIYFGVRNRQIWYE